MDSSKLEAKFDDGKGVNCCTKDGSAVLPEKQLHYSCFPIEIEPNDEFYGQYNQRCMNLVRSSLSPSADCKLGYGKQNSVVTHFLDSSPVYGVDMMSLEKVRSFRGGEMKMMEDYGREMLPFIVDEQFCGAEKKGCFLSGDHRGNQLISITALHTLFTREHNRIARSLQEINPHWTDETTFYESRAILSAKFQHIVYSEWLPLAIGTEKMNRFGLNPQYRGYSNDYNPDTNPSVTAEFTTAAFRFGHSVVDGKFVIHHDHEVDEIIKIPDVMFKTDKLKLRTFYDDILNTMTNQPMQQVDSAITKGLAGFLFRGDHPFGLDLAAINIHRGRDHAIRCYNDYLEATGQKRITDFREMGEVGEQLSKFYAHPDDIDLWVGGLTEPSYGDAVLGYTFSEIVADQFSRLKRGDKYFYDLSPDINLGYFSPDQLQEIRSTTMARLICDNVDGITKKEQAPRAFLQPGVHGNAPISCDNYAALPPMSYQPWKEEHH